MHRGFTRDVRVHRSSSGGVACCIARPNPTLRITKLRAHGPAFSSNDEGIPSCVWGARRRIRRETSLVAHLPAVHTDLVAWLERMGLKVWVVGVWASVGLAVTGCANNRVDGTRPPETAPRTVIAEPANYEGVYIDDSMAYREAPPPEVAAEAPDAVGYETLSTGEQVQVVEYIHTYPEPVETYPRVYWSGRWYYNVEGDFVFWSPAYRGWCYYWGPPAPLVAYWNAYYPWAPYYWGAGFYGPGWYWGGVGYYGYHAYGLTVVNEHHHHHHHYETGRHKHARRPDGPIHKGGPTGQPSEGGPTRTPAKRDPASAKPAQRTPPGSKAGPTATPPARFAGNPPAKRTPPDAKGPAKRSPAAKGPQRVAGTSAPQRTPPSNGSPALRSPEAAKRGLPVTATPQRTAPKPARRLAPDGNGGYRYTDASGREITVVDPWGGRPAPGTRTSPSRPTKRQPTTGPVVRNPRPAADRVRTPPSRPSATAPTWRAPNVQPSRTSNGPTRTRPSASPSVSPPRRTAPTYRAPTRSAPSRVSPPRRTAPPRSRPAPSRTPTRSYRPPPTRSRPSAAPRRTAPSRSSAPRRRSAPRSSGARRSAPRRSAGSRSSRSSASRGRSSSRGRSTRSAPRRTSPRRGR